ncbi:MAG: nucleotidyl transferase, partial [Desulfurococcales archaeon ex4484_58]
VKIFDKNGKFISREYVNRIENIFFREAYRKVLGDETGDIENPNDHYDLYIDKILKFIDLEKIAETRFLVDCCYGASSSLWNRLIKQYHLMIYQANCTEASSIPPHREPMIHQSIDSATKIIPTLKLDGGFIFDSDGDKVVVVSDRGNILSSEQLIALMSKILIEKIGSGKVALPHTFPRNIIEYIEELGGQIVFVEQGLIGLSKYLDKDLLLAADERGGIIYPWIHGGADAVLTTLFILEYLRENNLLLSTLIKELPVSLVVKDKVIVPFDKRGLFMRLIYEELREKEVDTLDGIKIIEEDLGWGYIRLIPNEPVVEFIAGSDSIDKADKLLKILREIADKILSKI